MSWWLPGTDHQSDNPNELSHIHLFAVDDSTIKYHPYIFSRGHQILNIRKCEQLYKILLLLLLIITIIIIIIIITSRTREWCIERMAF